MEGKTKLYNIYLNLIRMLDYRNTRMTSEKMPENDFVAAINHYEYVTITGVRPKDDVRGPADVYIILIAAGSKYAQKSQDFKKLLKNLPKSDHLEVMFVSESSFTTHIHRHMAEFKEENPSVFVESYDYEMFVVEKPKHVNVPRHEIAPAEEIEQLSKKYYFAKDNLPKILTSDPQAVWLGVRAGMVVKIYRLSETAGQAIMYRYAIRG